MSCISLIIDSPSSLLPL